ncbi:hypothetical protein GS429_10910 [Natronorubrum sp. JWXQ-INN-674]|uniref:TM2 domain-containing protein n=2 Tax=Natronorubrum TaxID=134813 RepID=A0A6B0VMX3_9EURY|nr:TM2 domain-containing protein [Natronorubrum tibetense GA33]MXV62563.1 hypothetical protein [Natronorubrum halalkaliphilum]
MLAALISFLIPGVGQIYNGQTSRGLAFLGIYFAFWVFTVIMMFLLIGFIIMFMAPLIHIAAAADAYIQAGKINAGEVRL